MSRYIHFTEEQKQAAKQTNLTDFLQSQGEKIKKSGSEFEWAGRHVTLRGNQFYDQYTQRGGTAVDFVRQYFEKSYPDAVQMLLGNQVNYTVLEPISSKQKEREPFCLPPANDNMRRAYAYLIQQRCIDRDVIAYFAHKGLIYEDAKYHNAVFVGTDQDGHPRHAHKKSTSLQDSSFRGNQAGSEAAFSFHHIGTGDTIYCFEAPIDMLSFITLHPANWKQNSYVALCSVADHALLQQLEDHQSLKKVALCLDNDEAGRQAMERIAAKLTEKGYSDVSILLPHLKDFNEDLQEKCGKLKITPSSVQSEVIESTNSTESNEEQKEEPSWVGMSLS